ncbi:MAG: Ribonuclease HepT-like [Candidatus Atribacteria bacterium]|nr:Ribonuclease HepT-like [Candidatus Atribacteria bacterium]
MDRERILSKIAELEGYLEELRTILPKDFEEFQKIEKKRACERLLQIAIEAVMDICYLLVRDLRLACPVTKKTFLTKLKRLGLSRASCKKPCVKCEVFETS